MILPEKSQMFNSNPKYQTKFSRLLNQLGFEINMRLIKSLVSLVFSNVPDPRLVPLSQDSGLVFGMISSLWKTVQPDTIPDQAKRFLIIFQVYLKLSKLSVFKANWLRNSFVTELKFLSIKITSDEIINRSDISKKHI